VETEAFFAFHHINAYEAGDHLLVDVACYPDARLVRQAELNHLRDEQGYINSGEFRRYRVPLKGGRATYERIGQELLELPVIHYRDYNTKPYRYAYGVGVRRGTQDFLNQLVKFDTMTGDTLTWHEAGCYPSEPVFAPAPQATREDEGVLLSVVLDTQAGRSFLLVQDAITFAEVARVPAPHWIPFSFHGQFWDDV
jgi:carotenoid cleavage dioxygenase-like enzyme